MAHEDLSREEHIEGSSDRSFGIVFAVVFAIIAAWPLLHGGALRAWAAGVAVAFAVVALVIPRILAVPNRLWMKLGLLMGKVVEHSRTDDLFVTPAHRETADYIEGRYG